MPVKESNKRITLTIDKELYSKVEKLAGYQNITVNATINQLLKMSIDAQMRLWEMMNNPESLEALIKATANLSPELNKEIKELDEEIKEKKDKAEKVNKLYKSMENKK